MDSLEASIRRDLDQTFRRIARAAVLGGILEIAARLTLRNGKR